MAEILFTPDAAARLGLSPSTLEKMRTRGDGPAYIQLGRWRVAYPLAELDRWIAARPLRASTSEYRTPRRRRAPTADTGERRA